MVCGGWCLYACTFICCVTFVFCSFGVWGYRQGPDVTDISDSNTYVRQKITKEAGNAWNSIPYEIKGQVM